jgi:hypothetical protein
MLGYQAELNPSWVDMGKTDWVLEYNLIFYGKKWDVQKTHQHKCLVFQKQLPVAS